MQKFSKILLVEDNPRDRELTLTALDGNNLANEIIILHDGEEALDYLYRRNGFSERDGGNPTVILLDIKMPKLDGIEVLRQLKNDPQLKLIPIVMLTSSREEKDLIEAYQLGVNAYVVKPVDFQEFVEAVKNVGLFWAIINETAI
ncbi:MAG: response regulator [Ignavibacteriales bacterium]|nr:response regulator [Ignavibacteriales bacterium]